MKFKVGDKVKFLNQNGGGIVVKIISPQMVSVAIEDGFEIPILASEILKIEETKDASSLFNNEKIFSNITTSEQEQEEDSFEEDRVSALRKVFSTNSISEGIYLAFVPHEQRWLVTGNIDIYILNYTPQELIFSLFLRDIETENFIGKDYDVLPANSKILLSTIERDELVFWSKGVIQGVFHTNNSNRILNPISVNYNIKEMRFLKEENYKTIPILDGKSIVISIASFSDLSFFVENKKDIEPSQKTATILNQTPEFFHKISEKIAEVDLHIETLSETTAHTLTPSEILTIQLKHFEEALNTAIGNNFEQVTFIHGVGSGKLKTEITQILKQYNGLHWFDAPMAKYGVGATNVLIGQHAKRNI